MAVYWATQIDYDLAKKANPYADVRLYTPGTQMGAGDYFLGGSAVLPDSALGGARRIGGKDRYETNALFSQHYYGAAAREIQEQMASLEREMGKLQNVQSKKRYTSPEDFAKLIGQAHVTLQPMMTQQLQDALRRHSINRERTGTFDSGLRDEGERRAITDAQLALMGQAIPFAMQAAGVDLGEQQQLFGQSMAQQDLGLRQFQAQAPYQYLTEYQRQQLPYQWSSLMGQVPGMNLIPVTGGSVSTGPGGMVLTLNGRQIDQAMAEALGGYVSGGTFYLPQHIANAFLGVR